MFVAAGVASGNSITISSYSNSNGHQLATITLAASTIGGNVSSNYTISRVLIDAAGNVIVVGYDVGNQKIVIVRLTSALTLDTTFNNPNGFITYAISSGAVAQIATNAIIHPDGRILVVGAES